MKGDPDNLAALVERVQRWLICKRWRKVIYGAVSVQKCKYACTLYAYASQGKTIGIKVYSTSMNMYSAYTGVCYETYFVVIAMSKYCNDFFVIIEPYPVARKISYRSENVLVLQRCVRMFLAMKKHRPR